MGILLALATLFAAPGKMIPAANGSRLSLYCSGTGSPTVVLESGFGGGTATTWYKLQPLLSKVTRTCSYDRAGYGFSELGSNLPRDLNHAVADLTQLLENSGEKAPYILVGHSNGGLLVGAYADLNPEKVAGLVFLDSAVVFPEDARNRPASRLAYLDQHLGQIRRCLERAEKGFEAAPGDECVDPTWYDSFPPDVARAEVANRSKPDFWRAYLSEAEANYGEGISGQAKALLPHKWEHIPLRVFTASIAGVSDAEAARAFGIPASDREALGLARAGRDLGEQRQTNICSLSSDCKAVRVPTTNHMVHNAALEQVTRAVAELVSRAKSSTAGAKYKDTPDLPDCPTCARPVRDPR